MAQTDLTKTERTVQKIDTEPYMPALLQEPDLGRIEQFLKRHFYYPEGW